MPARKKETGLTEVVQAILLGRCDDELATVFAAAQRRALETATVVWHFELDGIEFGEADLSPIDFAEIQKDTGLPWQVWNFHEDPVVQVAALRQYLTRHKGMDPDDANEWINSHSFEDTIKAFGWRDLPLAPASPAAV